MRMASVGITLLVGTCLVMLAAACEEGEEEATATATPTATATATAIASPNESPMTTPSLTPSATTAQSPTPSPTPDTASGVLSTCRGYPQERSDATIIASGILSRESHELLIDSQEFAAMSEELERVLGLIRNAYPAAAPVHARDPYVAGQVMLGLEPPLKEAVQNAVAPRPDAATFVTGQAAFDALNAQLGGVRGLSTSGLEKYGHVLLCLDDRVNVPAVSAAYSGLEGVRNASPNYTGGDGPDIDALRDGNTWYLVFRNAWGDCPAGCIYEELTFFTVAGDEVIAVEASQAAAEPHFAPLVKLVR